MIRRILAGLFTISFGLFLCSTPLMADDQTIDIKDQTKLPKKIELTVGDTVTFENGTATIEAKDADGKTGLFDSRPHNTFNQAGAYAVRRAGSGTIRLSFQSQGLATVARSYTIDVVVKDAPKVHSIEYKAPFPKDIQLKEGESVIFMVKFSADPGLYDPMTVPSDAKVTDGKKGDVLETATGGVKRLDKDYIQVKRYTAKRAGDAEISILHINGKTVGTIKITVK